MPVLIPLASLPNLPALADAYPAIFPALFASHGALGTAEAGWDILFAYPQAVPGTGPVPHTQNVFDHLDALWLSAKEAAQPNPESIPFRGGWISYVGYERLRDVEASVPDWAQAAAFPSAWMMRIPAAILVDRQRQMAWAMAETAFAPLAEQLASLAAVHHATPPAVAPVTALIEEPDQQYLSSIARVQQYIRAGDVFQVNLSRRWTAQTAAGFTPMGLHQRLSEVNPAPFSCLFRMDHASIISASPERLLRVIWQDGARWAQTKPIAGTHPRAADANEDAALKARLLASRKERAEHIMLVDLERNDLGRVCVPGSVHVPELLAVESYAFVHHLESCVRGKLRPEIPPASVLKALFPGGTITGCPKVRTMQIIRELETHPRGAYTGTVGYLNHDGSMDFNILIRSFMHLGSHLEFRAGGGIVADSDPIKELAETRAKAKGLLRALVASA